MLHFKPNKAAALLMPLGLSALPALAGAYGGYIRTQQQRNPTMLPERRSDHDRPVAVPTTKQLQQSRLMLTQGQALHTTPSSPQTQVPILKTGQQSREVMVIDASLADKSTFYKALKPGIEVIEIDDKTPIFAQLNLKLATYKSLDVLHWVSHGSQGKIHVGQQQISAASLNAYVADIKRLGAKLSADADIRFYNCNLAQGNKALNL